MQHFVNISTLCTMRARGADPLGRVENATLVVDEGRVVFAGSRERAPRPDPNDEIIDVDRTAVLPGFIDCHTHLLFAGSRANEFALRARGATYAEIMASGGGIRNTTRAVRQTKTDSLVDETAARLDLMLSRGVTRCEIKSGYGLSFEHEIRSLEAIDELRRRHPIRIHATCLAAHAVPEDYATDKDGYVSLIVDDILPAAAERGLVSACDVFIEKGAFSLDDARRILTKAADLKLDLHVHAEQLSRTGASLLAAELGALSCGHLEFTTEEDWRALSDAGVVAEVLGGAQVFLGMHQRTPGRGLIDAGVRVAVASDWNPGSAHIADLPLVAGISVPMCGLSVEDALLGITAHAALALGVHDAGFLDGGAVADFVLLNTENPVELVYRWGSPLVRDVFIDGKSVKQRSIR